MSSHSSDRIMIDSGDRIMIENDRILKEELPRSVGAQYATGDDGIPVELYQILKGDAVKVLYSICPQIWKTQQWPQDWKR